MEAHTPLFGSSQSREVCSAPLMTPPNAAAARNFCAGSARVIRTPPQHDLQTGTRRFDTSVGFLSLVTSTFSLSLDNLYVSHHDDCCSLVLRAGGSPAHPSVPIITGRAGAAGP